MPYARPLIPARLRLWLYIAAGVVTLALLLAFNPRLQTHLLNQEAARRLDQVSVARVWLLPWSIEVNQLDLQHGGITARVDTLRANFAPWRWLWRIVSLNDVELSGAYIDLSGLAAEPRSTPFSGLFAQVQGAPAVELDALSANAVIRLSDNETLTVRLADSHLEPDGSGELNFDITARNRADLSRLDAVGELSVAQTARTGLDAMAAHVNLGVTHPALPMEELLQLDLRAEPVFAPYDADAHDAGDERPRLTGERYQLTLSKSGDHEIVFSIALDGMLDAGEQLFDGNFEIRANDGLAAEYLPALSLPGLLQQTDGRFSVDLEQLSTSVELRGAVHVTDLDTVLENVSALPPDFRLWHEASLVVDSDVATLLSASIKIDSSNSDTVFSGALSERLSVALAAPDTVLNEARELATFTLHAVPLNWLNTALEQPAIESGWLDGAFSLRSDHGALVLAPVQPAALSDVALLDPWALPAALQTTVSPQLIWRDQSLALTLPDLTILLGDSTLGALTLAANVPVGGANERITVALGGEVDLNAAAALPPAADLLAGQALPPALRFILHSDLRIGAEEINIDRLDARVTQHGERLLVHVESLQPLPVSLAAPVAINKPDGEVLVIELAALDLAWIDPLLPQLSLGGRLAAAEFALAMPTAERYVLSPRRPLTFAGLRVADSGQEFVRDLDLHLRPALTLEPGLVTLSYTELVAATGGETFLRAAGRARVPLASDSEAQPALAGTLTLNMNHARRLPPVAAITGDVAPRRDWQARAEYDVTVGPTSVVFDELKLQVLADAVPRIELANTSPLTLKPRLAPDDRLAQYLTGYVTASINELSSALLGDVIALPGVEFATLSAAATLHSDGALLHADLNQALQLDGVRIGTAREPLLQEFSLTAAASVHASAEHIDVSVSALDVTFKSADTVPALTGQLDFALEPRHPVPLRTLVARLSGALPPLLDQPVLLPGHGLRQGSFVLDGEVSNAGAITIDWKLDGLVADAALAINAFSGNAAGQLAADGKAFNFRMPISGSGRTGITDAVLEAGYAPAGSGPGRLQLDFTSGRFLLNDVLAAVDQIRAAPKSAAPQPGGDAATPRKPDRRADVAAFWDVLPWTADLDYHIADLYYTDYVIFNDVKGAITVGPEQLALQSLAADFHASPLRLDGVLDFVASTPSPYALSLHGSIDEFDLNQFFSELVPGSKPRVEGLFSVRFDGHGTAPNMAEFRNELLFEMDLKSGAGLFRPLPPDSTLMAGASDVLGIVGEGLSYMPTGGFGAGAVSRLVNYIAEIDYDRIIISVTRDDSRDLVVEQFLVQSDTVSLSATGGIDYSDGKDILDSPLTLDAALNMSGKGAAILYSMDLLSDEQDQFGYYRGPTFRIRGTPAAAESNFGEIISNAADGSVKGGVLRPLSGLIGNIKHRWFGDDPVIPDEPAP